MPRREHLATLQRSGGTFRLSAAEPTPHASVLAASPTHPTLRAEVLGDGAASLDGRCLCLGNSTAGRTALCIILMRCPDRTPREWLIDQLWDDGDVASSRNRLNVALHSVRAALRLQGVDEVFALRGAAYEVTWPHPFEVDVREFAGWARIGEALTESGHLTDAVLHDGFAATMSSRDVLESATSPWVEAERERHRIARGDTLLRLGMNLVRIDRHQEAVDVAQLIFEREPWREDAHALVMLAFAASGRTDLALRQYERCVQTLQSALHLAPGPSLSRLHEDIRLRNDLSAYTAKPEQSEGKP